MENRRAFLQRTVFGIAAIGAAGPVRAELPEPAPAREPCHWLLAPLVEGDEIGLGWRLERVFPAALGAVTLNLAHADGRRARVDLSLREGEPRGPAHTHFIEFIVMDGADGAGPVDESLGRALRKLAAIVQDNEVRDVDGLAELRSHEERRLRHPVAMSQASIRLEPGVG